MLVKDPGDGVYREHPFEGVSLEDVDGFSGYELRSTGDRYEADAHNSATDHDIKTDGWLGYHESRDNPHDISGSWHDLWAEGFQEAAFSGRDPYVITQEMDKIRRLRAELGTPDEFIAGVRTRLTDSEISQAELARVLDLQPQNIGRWMNGQVEPTLESMLRIREALDRLESEATK